MNKKSMIMKRKMLSLLGMALLFTTVSMAQGFHFGVKGGANLLKIDNVSFTDQFKFGYSFGAFAELNVSKKLGIQPELLWSQNTFQTASNFSAVGNLTPSAVTHLNYLQVPVLLHIKSTKLLTFQAGPQFGILMNAAKSTGENVKDAFKGGDLSLLGGAQLNLGGLKAGARYVIGLNDINDATSQSSWKSQGIQLYVALTIL